MDIVQEEKNGVVCVTVKGRMEARLSPELERTIEAILKRGKPASFLIWAHWNICGVRFCG